MAQQIINNTPVNPDNLLVATTKINDNFTDLYANKQDVTQALTEISSLTPADDDMLVYNGGWQNWDVTAVRGLIVDGYAQPHSATLDALDALTPANGDILTYTNIPENSWTYITPAQLRTNMAASRPLVVDFMDDFLFPKFTSTTNIDSLIPWVGTNLTYYPTSFPYGAVGCYTAINQTNITKTLFVDNTYTGAWSTGFMLNSGTTNITRFNVARTASPATTGISYYGNFDSATVATANGAYFKVTDAGNLICVTKNASGSTTTDSGVTLPDNTFKTLSIVYSNADTGHLYFMINDVQVADHTTHIYTAGATKFGIACSYVGASGQSGAVWIDYLYLFINGVSRL